MAGATSLFTPNVLDEGPQEIIGVRNGCEKKKILSCAVVAFNFGKFSHFYDVLNCIF